MHLLGVRIFQTKFAANITVIKKVTVHKSSKHFPLSLSAASAFCDWSSIYANALYCIKLHMSESLFTKVLAIFASQMTAENSAKIKQRQEI